MDLAQDIIVNATRETLGVLKFEYQGQMIDLTPPWKKCSFAESVKQKFGIVPEDSAQAMLDKLHAKG